MRNEDALALLNLARDGDREAFGLLHVGFICKIVIAYLGRQNYRLGYHEPQDIAYDIAVKLLQNDGKALKKFSGTSIPEFKGYIRAMCRNLCIDISRQYAFERDHMVSLEEHMNEEEEEEKANNAIVRSINEAQARASKSLRPDNLFETEELFSKVVSQLPPMAQGVFKDVRIGMGYEDIAEKRGIPAGTVGSHISRSRDQLRAIMSA